MRILSLAQELETKTAELLNLCRKYDYAVKGSHLTVLTDPQVMHIKRLYYVENNIIPKKKVTEGIKVVSKPPKKAQETKQTSTNKELDSSQKSSSNLAVSSGERGRTVSKPINKSFEGRQRESSHRFDKKRNDNFKDDNIRTKDRNRQDRFRRDDFKSKDGLKQGESRPRFDGDRRRDDRRVDDRRRDDRKIDDKNREGKKQIYDQPRKEGLPRREKVIFITANKPESNVNIKKPMIEPKAPRFGKQRIVDRNQVVQHPKSPQKKADDDIPTEALLHLAEDSEKAERIKIFKDKRTTPKTKKQVQFEEIDKKKKLKHEKSRHQRIDSLLISDDDFETSLKFAKKGKKKVKFSTYRNQQPVDIKPKEIIIPKSATIKEVSSAFGIQMEKIISYFFAKGFMKKANDYLDEKEITEIASEYDIEFNFHDVIDRISSAEVDLIKNEKEEDPEELLVPRPPVVTMLGHVDHGKTSLLDYIRHSGVAQAEDGGITQHIGASVVNTPNGDIVFIDTPGHEAFTAMRSRGAHITDIAILVVAADDGVMPTTIEAYDHIKAANVEVIVALNKIDKPDANPVKVKGQLAKIGLIPSGDWGGATEVIECSAITGQGIDVLLETILLTAEVLNLQGNPVRKASGYVLESNKSETEGVSATLIVKKGTLKVQDNVIAGFSCGRIRAMFDSKHKKVDSATPSYPVRVIGLDEPANPGDLFYSVDNISVAQKLAERRKSNSKYADAGARLKVTTENILSLIQAGSITEVNLVIKADTAGSIEVLKAQLNKLKNTEVKANVIRAAVGAITENDILLAASSNALVIGFHVIEETEAKRLAKAEHVEMQLFRVIYELIDFVKSVLEGKLVPAKIEHKLGRAEIRKIFSSSKVGTIAGCYVTEGVVKRNAKLRLYRDGKEISPEAGYSLSGLKRNKDDAREVKEGFECGMVIENFNDIKERDILEFFELEERKRTLDEVEN